MTINANRKTSLIGDVKMGKVEKVVETKDVLKKKAAETFVKAINNK